MSLKAFHIFFIVASTLLALGFGGWAIAAYRAGGDPTNLGMGVGSLVLGAVLIVYSRWFLQKLKGVGYL